MINKRSAAGPSANDDDVEMILLRHNVTFLALTFGSRYFLDDHSEKVERQFLLFNRDHVVTAFP
jgi:hypothetical protein